MLLTSLSKIFVVSFGNRSRLQLLFAKRSFLYHFRSLAGFQILLCIHKCYLTCTVVLGSTSDMFRHIQALFKSILTHIQNFLNPWHIQNPGMFLSQSIFRLYGIFTILNIFKKLKLGRLIQCYIRLSFTDIITSRVILRHL